MCEHDAILEKFNTEGYAILPDVLTGQECQYYIQLIKRLAEKSKTYLGGYLREPNIIERDIGFSDLMDNPITLPIVKQLMHGFVRIMSTEAIIRTQDEDDPVRWHEDGPNCPSYRQIAVPPPLFQTKVGFFLNDITVENAGNLIVVPGSHKFKHGPSEDLPHGLAVEGAKAIKVKAGSVILFHNALWHCVQRNETPEPRYNLYYAYCYPWVAPFDRHASSEVLHSLLKGKQRELLMDFEHPGKNWALLKQSWRGDPKLLLSSPARMLFELVKRRARVLKRKIIGGSIN